MKDEEEYGQCEECGGWFRYGDLYVVRHEPDEDGYLVDEIYICKGCKEDEEE